MNEQETVPVEPEWEYGTAYTTGAGAVVAIAGVRISTDAPYQKVKRLKAIEAGPWLPVEPVQVDPQPHDSETGESA